MQEGGLHRMQSSSAARPSIVVIACPRSARERQAGEHAPAVDVHGAGTTGTAIATLLGAREPACSRSASSSEVRGSKSDHASRR